MKYRLHGKEKKLALGTYPDVGLAEARRIRDEAKAGLAAGLDPGREKVRKRVCGFARSPDRCPVSHRGKDLATQLGTANEDVETTFAAVGSKSPKRIGTRPPATVGP